MKITDQTIIIYIAIKKYISILYKRYICFVRADSRLFEKCLAKDFFYILQVETYTFFKKALKKTL